MRKAAAIPNIRDMQERIRVLVGSNRLGRFDGVEIVEVFGFVRGEVPCNVLSLVVVSEQVTEAATITLTPRLVQIDGFSKLRFGVVRTRRPFSSLMHALRRLDLTGEWHVSGNRLATGRLVPQVGTFVGADSTKTIPINRLLKNNFWAGSHVFRLLDADKEWLGPFLEDRRRIQELSDVISQCVPTELSGLADFLGDIVIQVPVLSVVPDIRASDDGLRTKIDVRWHPHQKPRELRAAGCTRWDETLLGGGISEPFRDRIELPMPPHEGMFEVEIWDDDGTLLAALPGTSTLQTITVAMHAIRPEPRLFGCPSATDAFEPARVQLEDAQDVTVGDGTADGRNRWRQRRQDLEEARRLAATREFVQYRPAGDGADERRRALEDMRELIKRHGRYGVDLWDPFLSAADLLQTLFWCPFAEAPLRALSAGREPAEACRSCEKAETLSFVDRQRRTLEEHAGNREGLTLEFRRRFGPEGWSFHDRFLIFPGAPDGPLAWSLGTSVNSLGQAHHIMQKVPNPALIAGAFDDLWSALDKERHLVWRTP